MLVKLHQARKPIRVKNPLVLITADGRTLKEDLEKFLSFGMTHDVYCIARSYQAYPGKMDHWANVDGDSAVWWAENLPSGKIHGETLRHTLGECKGFDIDWDIIGEPWNPDEIMWHGSTALFAVYSSLAMGYKRIVLAGAPMDSRGHWYDPADIKGPRWSPESYPAWLDFAKTPEAEKVKSLSGYTQQILGMPTKEWLDIHGNRTDKGN